MTTTNALPAAVYLRISLDRSGDGLAVERQREDCRQIAAQRGWNIIEEYVDSSISASNKSVNRPAYNKMVEDYAAGRFKALVCYDLDRLTRQPRQLEDWIDAAEEHGLKLVTANGEADLTTDGGRLFARLKAAVAKSEVERKSARQSRALRQRADNGRPPLGVRLSGYSTTGDIVEDEAKIVSAIFARFITGDSLRGIAAWINDEGHTTRRGGRWTPSTVRTILLNPRYCGRAVYQGQPTGQLGNWVAIVPEGTYDAAQAILTDPRRKTNRTGTDRSYVGSGIYLCGVCGLPLRSHSGSRYRCKDGHVVRSLAPVDAYVFAVVRDWLSRPDLLDLLESPGEDGVDHRGAEVSRRREQLARLERDYYAEEINGRMFKELSGKVEAELHQIEVERARATAGTALGSLMHEDSPADAFDAAPLGSKRAIIDRYLTVRVFKGAHGSKVFDPDTVLIEWKGQS